MRISDWSSDVCSSDLDQRREAASPLYDWRAASTYIRRPPYWEGALAGERTMRGMRPLAVLGDNITTDHLSPSNAILPDSARSEERSVGKAYVSTVRSRGRSYH